METKQSEEEIKQSEKHNIELNKIEQLNLKQKQAELDAADKRAEWAQKHIFNTSKDLSPNSGEVMHFAYHGTDEEIHTKFKNEIGLYITDTTFSEQLKRKIKKKLKFDTATEYVTVSDTVKGWVFNYNYVALITWSPQYGNSFFTRMCKFDCHICLWSIWSSKFKDIQDYLQSMNFLAILESRLAKEITYDIAVRLSKKLVQYYLP
jgi:hypothetical protein